MEVSGKEKSIDMAGLSNCGKRERSLLTISLTTFSKWSASVCLLKRAIPVIVLWSCPST